MPCSPPRPSVHGPRALRAPRDSERLRLRPLLAGRLSVGTDWAGKQASPWSQGLGGEVGLSVSSCILPV